eukprot:Pgem_evm1s15339
MEEWLSEIELEKYYSEFLRLGYNVDTLNSATYEVLKNNINMSEEDILTFFNSRVLKSRTN